MARMGFLLMGKIMAVTGPLWCCKMHYMGLKLGVFLQMGARMLLYSHSFESNGFTGVFLDLPELWRSGAQGTILINPAPVISLQE